VSLALEAAQQLWQEGATAARVVSMPSWELFEAQPREYRDRILPPALHQRVSVEAGRTLGWERYVGTRGRAIGIDRFGMSAPGEELFRKFGLTVESVVEAASSLVKRVRE